MGTNKQISFNNANQLLKLGFLSCLLVSITSFACFAQEETSIQNIPIRQFPALVYTQEDLSLDETQRYSLMIAAVVDGKADIQKIMSAQYISATQLSETVFLLQADQHLQDRTLWRQTQFLVDFKTGSKALVCDSISWDKLVHYYCLRSVPERDEAVLLRYGQGTDRNTLVHINLKTLETKTLYTLPEKDKIPGFSNNPRIKISPDFKQLAAIVGPNDFKQNQSQFLQFDFSLRVLNLDTMKTSFLDEKVQLQISNASSNMSGQPLMAFP